MSQPESRTRNQSFKWIHIPNGHRLPDREPLEFLALGRRGLISDNSDTLLCQCLCNATDLIHTAVRRIVVGDENSRAITSVKIINLSFGDPSRVFINMMSPLARLLDWLSYTYKILFIISAGNHNQQGIDIGIPFDEFKKFTPEERETMILQNLNSNSRNIRLLSPAESINNLSIGALFNDFSNVIENERFIFPYKQPLPSPVSAIGLGYNRSIKPDIFYNGGRKFVRESLGSTVISWIPLPTKPPGCCVATPGQSNVSVKSYPPIKRFSPMR